VEKNNLPKIAVQSIKR